MFKVIQCYKLKSIEIDYFFWVFMKFKYMICGLSYLISIGLHASISEPMAYEKLTEASFLKLDGEQAVCREDIQFNEEDLRENIGSQRYLLVREEVLRKFIEQRKSQEFLKFMAYEPTQAESCRKIKKKQRKAHQNIVLKEEFEYRRLVWEYHISKNCATNNDAV